MSGSVRPPPLPPEAFTPQTGGGFGRGISLPQPPPLNPGLAAAAAAPPVVSTHDPANLVPVPASVPPQVVRGREQDMTNTLVRQMQAARANPAANVLAAQNPNDATIPTPTEQEQYARDIPSKIFHTIGEGLQYLEWARAPVDVSFDQWNSAMNKLTPPIESFLSHLTDGAPEQLKTSPVLSIIKDLAGQTALGAATSITPLPGPLRGAEALIGKQLAQTPEQKTAQQQTYDKTYQQEKANGASDFVAHWNSSKAKATAEYDTMFGKDTPERLIWDTITDPINWVGWGLGENAGRNILRNAIEHPGVFSPIKQLVGHALIGADQLPQLPFHATSALSKGAWNAAKTLPLFEKALPHVEEHFSHGVVNPETGLLVGGSARAKIETAARSIQDILNIFREQGLNVTGFNAAHNVNPFSLDQHAFGGYTPQARSGVLDAKTGKTIGGWASQWEDLAKQASQMGDPVSKLYAMETIAHTRQAVARESADTSALVEKIKSGDPDTLRSLNMIDQSGAPTGVSAGQFINEQYDLLNNYNYAAQNAARKMLSSFTPNESLLSQFTPEQNTAAGKILDQLHGSVKGEASLARAQIEGSAANNTPGLMDTTNNIIKERQEIQAKIDSITGPTGAFRSYGDEQVVRRLRQRLDQLPEPTPEFLAQSKEGIYNHRNTNIMSHFSGARQALADTLTNGDMTKLHELIGLHDPLNNPVAHDFFRDLRTAQGQAVGPNEVSHMLPTSLSNFWGHNLADSAPKAAHQVILDRARLAKILQPKSNEILAYLGYTPEEISGFAKSGIQLDKAIHDAPGIPNDTLPSQLNARLANPLGNIARTKVKSLTDLVNGLQGKGVLESPAWTQLNSLNNSYRRGGDLLFDNDLKMISHKLINQKTAEYGPTNQFEKFWDQATHGLNIGSQAFKELLLLSPSYHPLVTGQELVTGMMHGIMPWEVMPDLKYAYQKASSRSGSEMPILPRTYQRALDLQGRAAPSAIPGLGSTAITERAIGKGAEARGGGDIPLTAIEQIPAPIRMLLGGALGFGAAGNTLNPVTILLGAFAGYHAPKMVKWNTEASRNVNAVLRAGPWHQKSQAYLAEQAPKFLDDFERALANDTRTRLSGTPDFQAGFKVNPPTAADLPVQPNTWADVPVPGTRAATEPQFSTATRPPPNNQIPEALNPLHLDPNLTPPPKFTSASPDPQAIQETINRLRARSGNFAADDLSAITSLFGAHDNIGADFSKQWLNHLAESDRLGIEHANHIHSDYGITSNFEAGKAGLNHIMPFYVWMNRLIPFYLRHGLEMPALAYNFIKVQKAMEEQNRKEGRLSQRYNQMVKLPGGEALASATTGQPGSYEMINPLSPFIPGVGIGHQSGGADEGALSQLVSAAGGLGYGTFPTVPFLLNTVSALPYPNPLHGQFNEPAPNLIRQDPVMTGVANATLPITNELYKLFGDHRLEYPLAQAQTRSADPEALFHAAFNAPRSMLGMSSPDFTDIATKRILADWSSQIDHMPNSPRFVAAMSNPGNPLYIKAKEEAVRRQNMQELTRFTEPFSTRAVSPIEDFTESQRSHAQSDFGPLLAELTSKYMATRYPGYNNYSMANQSSDELAQQQIPIKTPSDLQSQFGIYPSTPMPEMQAYLNWLYNSGYPQDQWFLPQTINTYLTIKSQQPQLISQTMGQSPFNPLTPLQP